MALRALSLCSGVGGLDLGLHLAVPSRTVCYVEREAFAASILAARMEDGSLAPASVWSDLRTFDGAAWRGAVDCVLAGFPCQPVSVAGKRLAQQDERWMWPHVARIVREVGPGLVFLENVAGLLVHGMGDVLRDLAALGFDAEWGVFSAAGVGAPHRRERVFILGYSVHDGRRAGGSRGDDDGRSDPGRPEGAGGAAESGSGLAHADDPRPQGRGLRGAGRADERPAWQGGGAVADADRRGREGFGCDLRPHRQPQPRHDADGRSGALLPLWPPGPDDDWSGVPRELWPVEPPVRRVADGVAGRVDRLRACGNGVVPLAAAVAFRTLAARAGLILEEA